MHYPNDLPKVVKIALQRKLDRIFKVNNVEESIWLANNTQVLFGAVPEDEISEFIEELPEGYSLSLVIKSDEGDGILYVAKTKIIVTVQIPL